MKTIYIKGIGHYKKNIIKALFKSSLKEGDDYIIGNCGTDCFLIWLKDDIELRKLKLGITAKYVWKNRLKFYYSIDEMNPKQEIILNESDLALLDQLKNGKNLQIL